MKICPVCQTTYDEFQNFCLKDGTPLVADEPRRVEPLDAATVVGQREPETVVSAATPTVPPRRPIDFNQPPVTEAAPVVIEKKSNTAKIVFLTAFGTILLVALAGGGVWLAMRNNQNREIAQANTDNRNSNRPRNTNSTANANASNVNSNTNANVNTNASPVPSPSPVPTLTAPQIAAVKKDVTKTIDDWKDSTESEDLDAHVGTYAPTVDFYNAKGESVSRVRADRQRAFDTYDTLEVELSNIKITPDAKGDKATVVLDKKWRFEGATISEGSVQQQLTLEKQNGRWLITGERDLKTYYTSKY